MREKKIYYSDFFIIPGLISFYGFNIYLEKIYDSYNYTNEKKYIYLLFISLAIIIISFFILVPGMKKLINKCFKL